jgi:hypothetical protein
VGLRKAIGAHREQLVGQFLLESFLLNTMAVLWPLRWYRPPGLFGI